MSTTNVRDDQVPAGSGLAEPVIPVPSASVIVLRDGPLEVLMIRRVEQSSFMPNMWVFPGGVADELDREIAREQGSTALVEAMRVCAARELFEETGLWLGQPLEGAESKRRRLLAGSITFRQLLNESPIDFQQLVWTSRWITPIGVPRRFDTFFFLVVVNREVVASAQESEAAEVVWIEPATALERNAAGELQMVFPTIRNLKALRGDTAPAILDARRGLEIPTTRPILVVDGGQKKIVLPEEA